MAGDQPHRPALVLRLAVPDVDLRRRVLAQHGTGAPPWQCVGGGRVGDEREVTSVLRDHRIAGTAVLERTARLLGGHPCDLLHAALLVDRHGDVDDADRGHAVGRIRGLVDVGDLCARAGECGGGVGEHVVAGEAGELDAGHELPPVGLAAAFGHDQPVDVPAVVAVVVAEQVEGDLGDGGDHASVRRQAGMDRVAGAYAGRDRRHLDRGIRLAVGAEHRLAITDLAGEHHPPAVRGDRRLARIGDRVRHTVHRGCGLRRHLTGRGVGGGGRYDDRAHDRGDRDRASTRDRGRQRNATWSVGGIRSATDEHTPAPSVRTMICKAHRPKAHPAQRNRSAAVGRAWGLPRPTSTIDVHHRQEGTST